MINIVNILEPNAVSEELFTFDAVSDTFLALRTAEERVSDSFHI